MDDFKTEKKINFVTVRKLLQQLKNRQNVTLRARCAFLYKYAELHKKCALANQKMFLQLFMPFENILTMNKLDF